jgi:hypothetical protein
MTVQQRNMGIGELANPLTIFKRQFRWTLGFNVACLNGGGIGESFVKTAARPNIQIEETEINFLNAKMWIPGKGAWQEMEVTYYDVANDALRGLWLWINAVYQIIEGSNNQVVPPSVMKKRMGSRLNDYTGTGTLRLYDGCGGVIETWLLYNAWPKNIDFGTLDMAQSEICEVKMTMRYSDVQYRPNCWTLEDVNCCNSCG